ncbi:MAG: extracellular solute-binding protein [Sedimentisphaerales bacterium]|jgi:ABC-type glycerol-3-phosphate transport system substrate-binding protein
MKRVLLFVTISILLVVVIFAVSRKGKTTTQQKKTAAPFVITEALLAESKTLPKVLNMPAQIADGRPVEITVVGIPPDSQPAILTAWNEQTERFEKLYPNVKIRGSDYAYAPDSFAALVTGKQVPTLFQVYLTDPGKMIDQGICADMSSIFEAQKLDKVYNSRLLSMISKNGRVYGIPMKVYTIGLAYNIKLLKDAGFDAPPTTWDELVTIAKKTTNRDAGIAGFSFITDGANAGGWHMTVIAYDFGFKDTDIIAQQPDGKYKACFNNAAMLSAMNFVKDLRWKHDVLPRENLGWETNGQAFATGRVAMAIMAGDQFITIRQNYPDLDMGNIGFAPLPVGPDGMSRTLGGGDIAMVSSTATADQVEAAAYYRLWTYFDPNETVIHFQIGKQDPTTVVGAPLYPLYTGVFQEAGSALERRYANLPVDNYKLYMDGIVSDKVIMMPEPVIAGQEYYLAMGQAVGKIVADKNVDPAAVLAKAAQTYQSNVLDLMK